MHRRMRDIAPATAMHLRAEAADRRATPHRVAGALFVAAHRAGWPVTRLPVGIGAELRWAPPCEWAFAFAAKRTCSSAASG